MLKTGKSKLYKMVIQFDKAMPIQAMTTYRYSRASDINWLTYTREDGTHVIVTFSYYCEKYILSIDETLESFPDPITRITRHEIPSIIVEEMKIKSNAGDV